MRPFYDFIRPITPARLKPRKADPVAVQKAKPPMLSRETKARLLFRHVLKTSQIRRLG